jgi:hypothetical protein
MESAFRHQWYQRIFERQPAIVREAASLADTFGYAGKVGLYQGSSSIPGRLPDYVIDAIAEANRVNVLPARKVADEIRDLVKTVYGDQWDCVVTNTAEAGLRIAYDALMAPPTMRKGDAYRTRVLQILGEDFEWGAAYGRPFPPKYKNIAMDRTVAGGELGLEGKSLANVDTLFVRAPGVKYEVHGVRPNVVPLMTGIDVEGTIRRLGTAAERHATMLSGVHAVGYDTPGWGFGEKDRDGIPILMRAMGELAGDFDVPLVVDAATCLPFVGLDPRRIGADVMIYSMDKAGRSPIAGLVIGKAEPMNVLRKAMGWGGPRTGGTSSYSKAVFSAHDPGRDSLVGLLAFLKAMHERPALVTDPVDGMYAILIEELEAFRPKRFRQKLIVTKSHHMGGIEINYAPTWDGEGFGLPLYNLEDLYIGANAFDAALVAMGQAPSTIYGGNVLIGPGLGLIDGSGKLDADATRAAFRGLVKAFEIVSRHAGLDLD